jgi:hypothetical protein
MWQIDREQQVLELEKLQIDSYKAQGYTAAQLANMGFTEGIEAPANIL